MMFLMNQVHCKIIKLMPFYTKSLLLDTWQQPWNCTRFGKQNYCTFSKDSKVHYHPYCEKDGLCASKDFWIDLLLVWRASFPSVKTFYNKSQPVNKKNLGQYSCITTSGTLLHCCCTKVWSSLISTNIRLPVCRYMYLIIFRFHTQYCRFSHGVPIIQTTKLSKHPTEILLSCKMY